MKTLLSLLVLQMFFLSANYVEAYSPVVVEPDAPYEPILLEGDTYQEKHLLGSLDSQPDLYEFYSEVDFSFRAQIRQKDTNKPVPFGLLLVRQNDTDGAVTEVARQNTLVDRWQQQRYVSIGMTLLEAPVLERELTAGTYRLEVSTPDNIGQYMLVTGEDPSRVSLLERFLGVFVTQHHFGSFLGFALLSPYVSIPLFILLLLVIWSKRKWDSVKL